jgi:transglutaminase/protease-like cytokinesis protein 3
MKRYIIILVFLFSISNQAQKSDFKHINFKKADAFTDMYQDYTLENLPLLAYNLTNSLDTQVEKFRAIYTWVCSNIESDHSFGELTLKKRRRFKNDSIAFTNWNREVKPRFFKRLLKQKKTICTGYAYLVRELANLVDIECEIVNGYSRTTKHNIGSIDIPNHSWNTVKLNGKWYLVDATLASGYYNVDEQKFVKSYNDGYFLAAPKLYATKYFPLEKKWLLTKDEIDLKQFVNLPVTYGSTFRYGVIPVTPNTLLSRIAVGEEVMFRFKIRDKWDIEYMQLVLNSGLRSERLKVNPSNYDNGIIEMKYRFNKRGNYTVHFMVNKDVVVSYNIKVVRANTQIGTSI